jgi:predicted nucleic acid-binding protein
MGAPGARRPPVALKVLVVDSSAALRASSSAAARRQLAGTTLIGPPLLWSEVMSAIHEALWRRDLTAAAANGLRTGFRDLAVKQHQPEELRDRAWALADELGLAKTYDAEFLALASLRGCRLLTTDGRLRRGADRTGLVVSPDEL